MTDDDSEFSRCITPSELAGGVRTAQQTAYFTLPNGIRCLYLEDSSEEMATVAVTVGVGYFDSPPNIHGLATLVEKMIVLGSTKYPSPNELSDTCSAQGGDSSISTEGESTTITATIPLGALRETFDRISDMISEPLLPQSAVAAQIAAITMQHEESISDIEVATKQLIRDLANPSHPLHGFASGNNLTLSSIPNIVDALAEWVFRYFVAENITICVTIPNVDALQPEELEALLVETFNRVRKGVAITRSEGVPCFSEHLVKSWIKVISPGAAGPQEHGAPDGNTLKLLFPVNLGRSSYRSQALAYICHFLGANASGSCIAKLLDSGLITSGRAECMFEGTNWSVLSVTVQLSDNSDNFLDDIVIRVLQGIYVIKANAIDSSVWGSVSKLVSRHLALSGTTEEAKEISKRMLFVKPEHLLVAGRAFIEYSATEVAAVVESLTSSNMIGIHVSNHPQNSCPLQSAWGFSLRYNILRMPDSLLMLWNDKIFPIDADMKLSLVPRNEWIPMPSELHKSTNCTYEGRTITGTYPSPPTVVYSESVTNSREGILNISLLFPICILSPLHAAALLLFSVMINYKLSNFIREAAFHRLTVLVEVPKTSQCRLNILLHGPGSVITALIKDTLSEIIVLLSEWQASTRLISPDEFQTCRTEAATLVLMKCSDENPVVRARSVGAMLFEPEAMHTASALVQGLSELTLDDLGYLYPSVLLTPSNVAATLSGSFSRNQETALSRLVLEDFVLSLHKLIPPNCLLARGGSSMVGGHVGGAASRANCASVRLSPSVFDSFLVIDTQNTEHEDPTPQPCGVTVELCFLPSTWNDTTLCVATSVLSGIIHNEIRKWTNNIDPSIDSGCSYEAYSSCTTCVVYASSSVVEPLDLLCMLHSFIKSVPHSLSKEMVSCGITTDVYRRQTEHRDRSWEGQGREVSRMNWGVLHKLVQGGNLTGVAKTSFTEVTDVISRMSVSEMRDHVSRLLLLLPNHTDKQSYSVSSITPGRWKSAILDWYDGHIATPLYPPNITPATTSLHAVGLTPVTVTASSQVPVSVPSFSCYLVASPSAFASSCR